MAQFMQNGVYNLFFVCAFRTDKYFIYHILTLFRSYLRGKINSHTLYSVFLIPDNCHCLIVSEACQFYPFQIVGSIHFGFQLIFQTLQIYAFSLIYSLKLVKI